MNVVVTYIGEGISYYPELTEWVRSLDRNPDDPMFEALALMEGDPDKIRCDGNEMYFIDVTLNGVKYILTSDYPDNKEKEMLSRFHSEGRDEYFEPTESSWDVFYSLPDAIAYRCGGGYYYGINKYK